MLNKPEVSPAIEQAARRIVMWLGESRGGQQVFKVDGYAGTGKTTLISRVISLIGADGVYCAAFTGKAALVMRQKGAPNSSTIHRLIYSYARAPEAEIRRAELAVEDAELAGCTMVEIRRLRQTVEDLRKPRWKLNRYSEVATAKLLILDEVSMVDKNLGEDLMSFGTPTLVVGDPGQLPPPRGSGYFDKLPADITLEEIYRQEDDSPIIEMATDIRTGRRIRDLGRGARVIKGVGDITTARNLERLSRADQVIVGLNRTRRNLNRLLHKQLTGSASLVPSGADGEKLICCQNDATLNLVNGMFVRLSGVGSTRGDEPWFQARLWAPNRTGQLQEDRGIVRIRKQRFGLASSEQLGWSQGIAELDWAYAITCHKAQGSEWDRVIVIDDGLYAGQGSLRRRWLYTAVTRASDEVAILRDCTIPERTGG